MKKSICLSVVLMLKFCLVFSESSVETGTVSDVDGNAYRTVKIGNTWWMAENLRTKHFRDGSKITIYPDSFYNTSGAVVTGGSNYDYCVHYTYPNKDSANVKTYGLNYTWSAVFDNLGVCPEGWSVPDTTDWFTLAKYITTDKAVGKYSTSGYSEVGKYLKSDSLWNYNSSALSNDDAYGLGLVPSGDFDSNGYNLFGQEARFWTKEEVCAGMYGRYYIGFKYNSNDMVLGSYRNNNTVCVRCIKSALSKLEEQLKDELLVYPTCTSGQLTIKNNDSYKWMLYNLDGVSIASGKTDETIMELNLSGLPASVYILSVESGTKTKQVKIIKK